MSVPQFDVINAVMDSQLAEFRVRRSAAERVYEQRYAQFGDVVVSTEVEDFGHAPVEQGAFLRSASESMPGDTATPAGAATPGHTTGDSRADYRETAWLRRVSD